MTGLQFPHVCELVSWSVLIWWMPRGDMGPMQDSMARPSALVHGSRLRGAPARPTGATWGSSVEGHAQRVTSQLRDTECRLLKSCRTPAPEGDVAFIIWTAARCALCPGDALPASQASQSRSLGTRSARAAAPRLPAARGAAPAQGSLPAATTVSPGLFHTRLKFCLHRTIYPVLLPFVFSRLHLNFVLYSSLFSW